MDRPLWTFPHSSERPNRSRRNVGCQRPPGGLPSGLWSQAANEASVAFHASISSMSPAHHHVFKVELPQVHCLEPLICPDAKSDWPLG
jgi:hypothetical protein